MDDSEFEKPLNPVPIVDKISLDLDFGEMLRGMSLAENFEELALQVQILKQFVLMMKDQK